MAAKVKYTNIELANKIEWEGGLYYAVEYGITSKDIADPEIAALWLQSEKAYKTLQAIFGAIKAKLPEPTE